MLRNKLVRSDGSIIDSSVIISCEFTEEVNSGENLSVGDVTSSEINVEIRSTDAVEQGEVLTYYIIEDGVETLIGVFNAEKPTVASRTSIKFSAYDNIAKSEKIFSDWLRDNQGLFPMTLAELVMYACQHCGLTLAATAFPQSEIQINAFYADGITCRQILSWAGAIAGKFIRANSNGKIEFAWYTDATNITVAPRLDGVANSVSVSDDGEGNVTVMSTMATIADDGAGNVSLEMPGVKALYSDGAVILAANMTVPYKQGSLSYEAYATDIIERVQIKQSEDDVGVIYPADATGNCFVISGNMILATCDTETITFVATRVYEQLSTISYVPILATLPRTISIRAGDIINIRDPNDTVLMTYVMKVSISPSGTNIESTGNKSYETNAAVANEKYTNLVGKVLEIRKSIDGLKIENKDLSGKVAGLDIKTDEIRTYVEETYVSETEFTTYKSEMTQTSNNVELRFQKVEGDIRDTKANIRIGELEQKADGTPVFGIELGQQTEEGDETTFDKYARFTSEKLSFFDGNANEVTQIGDKKMSVTNVEIIASPNTENKEYGTLKQGDFVDSTREDGSIVTKWVGGK